MLYYLFLSYEEVAEKRDDAIKRVLEDFVRRRIKRGIRILAVMPLEMKEWNISAKKQG